MDFCEGFEDEKLAVLLLRQEIVRAGLDVTKPSREGLLKVVEYLGEAEYEFKEEKTVKGNKERRLSLAKNARE